MYRRHILSLPMIAALGLALLPGSALAQQKSIKDQLVGTWTIVSNESTAPDGKKSQLFGPKPNGILILASNGQYAQIIVHPDVPKFKVNNRQQGTPEENAAAVRGTTANFGTWTVDEASKTITVRVAGGLFPNQTGMDTKRIVVSVTADELKITNPLTASGMRSESVWKRVPTVVSN